MIEKSFINAVYVLTLTINKLTIVVGDEKMSHKARLYIYSITSVLFVILVFMNFVGYWQAAPSIQILFFFIMIAAIFNAGIVISKHLQPKS